MNDQQQNVNSAPQGMKVTLFHERGFLPGPFTIGDNVTARAAMEAVVGFLIEMSVIATFTQCFFER